MPDLAAVEAVASDTPSRTVTLSGISVAVLLSCLDAANRWFDWFSDGKQIPFTDYERVLGYLSLARTELFMTQIGTIGCTASEVIPPNTLLCDGGTYDKADYPDLYASLAPAFIIDADTFSVPDLRNNFILGAATLGAIGTSGGEATHTLTVDEIPSHSHTIPLTATTLAVEPGEVAVLTPVPILTSSTGDTGGGAAHNNMPPYTNLLYFIFAR